MKVTSQLLENCQAELVIEVDDERVEKALHSAAKRIANKANIPGFRKGKAPYSVVLRTFGEQALYEEAVDQLGQQVYREAIEEAQLDPYGPGEMKDMQLKPLKFTMTVPLRPVAELGDYRSLRVPFNPTLVSEQAVENVLKGLQERNAIMEPDGEGPAQTGQVAVLTIEGRLGAEQDAQELMHEHGINVMLAETTDYPFPGFVQHVLGMMAGEERAFELTTPENYDDQELRGKTVYFNVKLEELKTRQTPPLDDALAQTVGEYETLDALRAAVRQSLELQAAEAVSSQYLDECVRKLAEQAHIEFPPPMTEEELDKLILRAEQRLKDQKMSLDEFLNIKKQSREEYRQELRPRAEKNVRQGLALSTLAELEQIQVGEDEVLDEIQSVLARYGQQAAEIEKVLSTEGGKRSMGANLLTAKVTERLMSICKGENPPLPVAEPAPEAGLSAAEPTA